VSRYLDGGVSELTFSFRADQNRHLCLYFYDILCLNGENLLDKPLSYRRQLLEENVRVIPGFVRCPPERTE